MTGLRGKRRFFPTCSRPNSGTVKDEVMPKTEKEF